MAQKGLSPQTQLKEWTRTLSRARRTREKTLLSTPESRVTGGRKGERAGDVLARTRADVFPGFEGVRREMKVN